MEPTEIMRNEKIRKIVCGYCHTAILNEKNELYVMGSSSNGRTGLGKKRFFF